MKQPPLNFPARVFHDDLSSEHGPILPGSVVDEIVPDEDRAGNRYGCWAVVDGERVYIPRLTVTQIESSLVSEEQWDELVKAGEMVAA